MPIQAVVGKPVQFKVNVISVGQSQKDNDFAEDFHLLLREAASDDDICVELQPDRVLGAPGPSGKGERPPATLEASWTPERPGRFVPHFGCTYTDAGHVQRHKHLVRLDRGQICRTHIGTLQFAQHMQARSIFLGYETRRRGWENVAELGLAEMAAFSGGGGFASTGAVQAKYREFFKEHAALFDGWTPTAPAAVLLARWGSNPLAHVRPLEQPTIHDYLTGSQRLSVVLIDSKLPDEASRLEQFQVIYLQAREYDMAPTQLDALLDYVHRGGWLVASNKQITINGRTVSEVFDIRKGRSVGEHGDGKFILWDWNEPVAPTRPLVSAEGLEKNLRFALYRRDERFALHAVNYNVCLEEKDKTVMDLKDVEIKLPVPEDWTAVTASCIDPDVDPVQLDCQVKDGIARFSLPGIHLYKIVVLGKQ